MSVLAIDQGTTSTGALLLEDDGRPAIVHRAGHAQHYPASGWVEHDPDELMVGIRSCIAAAGEVAAIGLDNQGESCLAWNADTKEAISPVIVWQDSRTQGVVERLAAEGCAELVLETAGLPLESYFSASKLGWIVAHLPEAKRLLEKGKLRLGTTDAFFLDRLSGRFVTDITTASRTSLMNLATGQWDPALCELFGVPLACLPEIVSTTGDFGAIDVGRRRIPITASVVDQQAALYGHGHRQAGDAKITFGTGAFALVITGDGLHRAPDKGLLPTVAWRLSDAAPVYALDGGVYCAGAAVDWARGLGLFQSFDEINRFDGPHAIERKLAFVPALAGLACPHWDRAAAGLWIGLSLDTAPRDMVQAVLEGVAFRAAEVLGAMAGFVSLRGAISIDGGLSDNPYFCQFLANALDRVVTVPAFAELTALGTAMLAREGRGDLLDLAEAEQTAYRPDHDLSDARVLFCQAVSRARAWS